MIACAPACRADSASAASSKSAALLASAPSRTPRMTGATLNRLSAALDQVEDGHRVAGKVFPVEQHIQHHVGVEHDPHRDLSSRWARWSSRPVGALPAEGRNTPRNPALIGPVSGRGDLREGSVLRMGIALRTVDQGRVESQGQLGWFRQFHDRETYSGSTDVRHDSCPARLSFVVVSALSLAALGPAFAQAQLEALLASEIKRWREVIVGANIEPD